MPNSNLSKFTQKELGDIYSELILYFENSSGLHNESLSTRAKGYRKLLQDLNLKPQAFATLDELANENIASCDGQQSQLFFHDAKKNQLKSIFYHLRNAAAHADIKRVTCNKNQIWYCIEHRHKQQLKMIFNIRNNDFWCFVKESKKMKKLAKLNNNVEVKRYESTR